VLNVNYMTPNASLALSVQFQNLMRMDLLKQISLDFPYDLISSVKSKDGHQKRDRVYTDENTLLTMLATAVQQDKSLQQSVNIFSEVFENRSIQIRQLEAEQLAAQQQGDHELKNRMGRPRLYRSKLPKSKTKPLSTNTAAFAKARQRLDYGLVKEVFNYSKKLDPLQQLLWHGMQSFNTDGTYIQMQDSEALRQKFYVKQGDGAYPQALLQAIVCYGSGQIIDFEIGTRHQSELELIAKLIAHLPANSLLLADDLYNSYAIFSLLQKSGCHLIVPGKRDRNYTVVRQIAEGDDIVQLKRTWQPNWWKQEEQMPETLLMRRLSYLSPIDGQTACILYTTLMDQTISKPDIIVKYTCRWDIEITIREIKTLMDINVVRSKSEDMVLKEITIALSAYNIVRKIMAQSVEQTDFSPQKDIFQKLSETYKDVLIDKKGRVYQRWSPGRYGKTTNEH
jgi:hypothetical protein